MDWYVVNNRNQIKKWVGSLPDGIEYAQKQIALWESQGVQPPTYEVYYKMCSHPSWTNQ